MGGEGEVVKIDSKPLSLIHAIMILENSAGKNLQQCLRYTALLLALIKTQRDSSKGTVEVCFSAFR